jgi:protocatechuate 3,4-dioxygenase beta subunit
LETIQPGEYPGRTAHIHVKVFAPDGTELLTTQIYIPGVSDQSPDGIFSSELLAQDLEPGAGGQRRLEFNFVVGD